MQTNAPLHLTPDSLRLQPGLFYWSTARLATNPSRPYPMDRLSVSLAPGPEVVFHLKPEAVPHIIASTLLRLAARLDQHQMPSVSAFHVLQKFRDTARGPIALRSYPCTITTTYKKLRVLLPFHIDLKSRTNTDWEESLASSMLAQAPYLTVLGDAKQIDSRECAISLELSLKTFPLSSPIPGQITPKRNGIKTCHAFVPRTTINNRSRPFRSKRKLPDRLYPRGSPVCPTKHISTSWQITQSQVPNSVCVPSLFSSTLLESPSACPPASLERDRCSGPVYGYSASQARHGARNKDLTWHILVRDTYLRTTSQYPALGSTSPPPPPPLAPPQFELQDVRSKVHRRPYSVIVQQPKKGVNLNRGFPSWISVVDLENNSRLLLCPVDVAQVKLGGTVDSDELFAAQNPRMSQREREENIWTNCLGNRLDISTPIAERFYLQTAQRELLLRTITTWQWTLFASPCIVRLPPSNQSNAMLIGIFLPYLLPCPGKARNSSVHQCP
ncbi:uncharacterized protein CLUP02_00912 [Colletotrichum lupini]|uniref:Uncharacterized protein n=1 Tax=Colletotrichum lupini TaxID=145971 RepID=A0A9Q8SBP1_9PEZI|nr:uncharacterized protein CLUP02_00912 [Colletotrichum lupini]UQC74264.1 hypothetical protein CLUP02_00912 [Colletotrichum lupini]